MSVEQFADESTQLKTLLKSIADDFLTKISSIDEHITTEIDEIGYVSVFQLQCDKHFEKLEAVVDTKCKCMEALQESVRNLTEQKNGLVEQNLQLETTLKQLVEKSSQRKNKLEEIKLLNKSYRSLTGIDFNTSNNTVLGFIFNAEKNVLKPFHFQRNEDEERQEEKIWKMLSDIFL